MPPTTIPIKKSSTLTAIPFAIRKKTQRYKTTIDHDVHPDHSNILSWLLDLDMYLWSPPPAGIALRYQPGP